MAHNLHDKNGLYIVGLDGHIGLHFPPIIATVFFWEITAVHPFAMGSNFRTNILFNGGTPSVVDQHNPKFLWPHIPFEPDPLNMLFPLDVVFGDHKTWLPRLQVLLKGTPAAPTVFPGCLSINVNCWAFGHLPTNLVLQVGTVQTTPTAADYAYGAIRWAVDFAIEVALFFLTGGFGEGTAFTEEGIQVAYKDIQDKAVQAAMDKLGNAAYGQEGKAAIEAELNNYVKGKIMAKVFTYPKDVGTAIKTGYTAFTGSTGFDAGQGIASAVTGEGPGPHVAPTAGKVTQGIGSKFVPIIGPIYSAATIG
jgi:hypothetical protein